MFQRLRRRAQAQEGFTLIELLVVILIIGILAAVAIPAFLSQKSKANDAAVKSDVNTAQTAEETYATGNNTGTYVSARGQYVGSNPLLKIEPTLSHAFTPEPNGDSMVVKATGGGLQSIASIQADAAVTSLSPAGGASGGSGYVIRAIDPAGVTFILQRTSTGDLARSCLVPRNVNPGGCNTPNGDSGKGTW